ncbi:MAG TPA: hypothetical protein VH796_02970 [Nitrososphaeraceae archaeon]
MKNSTKNLKIRETSTYLKMHYIRSGHLEQEIQLTDYMNEQK